MKLVIYTLSNGQTAKLKAEKRQSTNQWMTSQRLRPLLTVYVLIGLINVFTYREHCTDVTQYTVCSAKGKTIEFGPE